MGESLQAGSVFPFASGFHPAGVDDGYFVQSDIVARPINSGPSYRAAGSPPFPDYAITGAAHSTVHTGIEIVPGVMLEDLCLEEVDTVAGGPGFGSYVINALWERMQAQVLQGKDAPAGSVMDTVPGIPPLALARDENGAGPVRPRP